ncbi:DUF6801 domain-containing protein [Streptomyces sp. QL37]|uniref:DUF6801 domain-containing protein n=1 Tax=Streptomyces sp. QL37 TaxID=2093747 RepID=UPI0021CB0276|nr:DUF6801 domain-containing protein [Streptomyces sp. QL37]
MQGARRRTARGAAVGAAILLGGMIPGAEAASGVQEVDAELSYTCAFPGGEQPVKVGITAELPESARPGQVVQPDEPVLHLTLPESMSADLAGAGAATVSAETRLAVDVSQNEGKARAEWLGTAAEPTPLPDAGALTLSTSGGVPYVKPGASGDLVFEASTLTVELTPEKADGLPAGSAPLSADCAPDPEQDMALAVVGVSGGEDAPGEESEATPSETWPGEREPAEGSEGAPEVGAKAGRSAGADAPACVGDPSDGANMVAYVTGYANVTKLDGANKFPLACARITQGFQEVQFIDGILHFLQNSTIDLDYQGKPQLPPTTGTFLTFGFMPTTATLEMTQIPTGTRPDGSRIENIHSDLAIEGVTSKNRTDVTIDFMLRLYDVKVNGVPLDVGDNCRTSRPFKLDLVGLGTWKDNVLDGYTLASGGELTGSVTIPPFSGCGTDEDLDNLFTASLSGVPGYVKQVQGAPCAAAQHPPEPGGDAACTDEYEPLDVPEASR